MAAELAVEQARARAGARLRGRLPDAHGDVYIEVRDVPNSMLSSTLATLRASHPELCDFVETQTARLMVGSMESFNRKLRAWGYDPAIANAVTRATEAYAQQTLLDSNPAPLSAAVLEEILGAMAAP